LIEDFADAVRLTRFSATALPSDIASPRNIPSA
jgi:hypothetical protein